MALVDRNILRLGVYEISYGEDIPYAVAINEAVDLGKRFGAGESGAFVNGILDKVSRDGTEEDGSSAASAGRVRTGGRVKYRPQDIEGKWQKTWDEAGVFRCPAELALPKYYCLEMFPYPSGRIHMGHVRVYTIGDLLARFKRMRGYQVLHPIGWDAFGLPAENAAHRHGTHPAKWTWENIAFMREQLKQMGISYDWDREIATCSPDYYRWEQLFFLWMMKDGLAYRKRATLNWCEECQTVLANEQVNRDGTCFIHDHTPVKQKELDQWFFAITRYAEELLEGHKELAAGWPENILEMQRNWIGRSEGAELTFPLADGEGGVTVFTTRPDTLYGATFMSMAPSTR
jgi:leucyl-tRNA synthetase